MRRMFSRFAMLAIGAAVLALTTTIASADGPNWTTVSQDFHGLLFGLNVGQGDNLLVAVVRTDSAGSGRRRHDADSLAARRFGRASSWSARILGAYKQGTRGR